MDERPGAKRGGKRQGAGRPKGVSEPLPRGSVKALRFLARRTPKDAVPDDHEAIALVEQRVTDVLAGKVHASIASAVLKAACVVADGVCGTAEQKHVLSGPDGGPVRILRVDMGDE